MMLCTQMPRCVRVLGMKRHATRVAAAFSAPRQSCCVHPGARAWKQGGGTKTVRRTMRIPLGLMTSRTAAGGFWGSCFNDYQTTAAHEGYETLRRWLSREGVSSYVYTSNVDAYGTSSERDLKTSFRSTANSTIGVPCNDRAAIKAPPEFRFAIDPSVAGSRYIHRRRHHHRHPEARRPRVCDEAPCVPMWCSMTKKALWRINSRPNRRRIRSGRRQRKRP